ncbi:MAG: hypothetical protein Aurels2KO_22420 [Aureliella sp.]
MKVLMICPELPSSGSPGSMAPTLRQIESLKQVGVDPVIYDMRGMSKVKYLQAIPSIRSLAAEVDLVHAHFGYCGWLAQSQRKRKVVLSFMGSDVYGDTLAHGRPGLPSATVAALNRSLLTRCVDSIIVKSKQMARLIEPFPATVIPNGVDLDCFKPLDQVTAQKRLGWNPDDKYVLFPGNPDNPRKGYPLAKQAVERLREQHGISVRLVVLWGVEPEKVPLYMNACDIMTMMSFAEGSPNVVKEGMACNLPIVTTEIGDVDELCSGIEGCTIVPRNPDVVASALRNTLENARRSQGRGRVFELGLDMHGVASRVLAVYEKTLG